MTAIEVAYAVYEQKQAHLFRPRKGAVGQYDVKVFEGNKRGWTYLDLFTASCIVAVHKRVSVENQTKFASMPLVQMVMLALKILNHVRA